MECIEYTPSIRKIWKTPIVQMVAGMLCLTTFFHAMLQKVLPTSQAWKPCRAWASPPNSWLWRVMTCRASPLRAPTDGGQKSCQFGGHFWLNLPNLTIKRWKMEGSPPKMGMSFSESVVWFTGDLSINKLGFNPSNSWDLAKKKNLRSYAGRF